MAGKGRIENLKHFPKGVSGNPKGRAKKIPALDVLLGELFGTDKNGESDARKLLETLKKGALTGKLNSVRLQTAERVADRIWGKPKSNDTLNLKVQAVEEILADEKAKATLSKYGLQVRGNQKKETEDKTGEA